MPVQSITPSRDLAFKALWKWEKGNMLLDPLLDGLLSSSELSSLDRALVTELVNGTIKFKKRLDWILDLFLTKGMGSLDFQILSLLRLGSYQIIFSDRIPDFAAVDQTVNLAKVHLGQRWANLVNGVLRNIIRDRGDLPYPPLNKDPLSHISTYYSHPEWMVKRWLKRFGLEGTISLCQWNNQRPRLSIRLNSLKAKRESLEGRLLAEGIRFKRGRYLGDFYEVEEGNPLQIKAFSEGLFQVQDQSAGLAVLLLGPKPGEKIIDLCAAPGGKLCYIAQLTQGEGKIIGVDISSKRLKLVRENCQRLGIELLLLLKGDGRYIQARSVDKVLIDAPCSGLGVLKKRADLRWKMTPQRIKKFVVLQRNLLQNGAELLKRGGLLVYSTCTIEPKENQLMVEGFLRENKRFKLERADSSIPRDLIDPNGFVYTFPHLHHIDGSFAVGLRKVG